jgi:serine/threonine protein kinase/Tol biopolymer transport system component
MALTPGSRVGPFEIVGSLGAGGMGEVYRARDTRLHRDVALKVLPELLSQDPDRRARFEREATVLAALNHRNIAAVYGIAESVNAIVMEFVEAETLADRIARGPLHADEAVEIARQIAEALDAAHESGIVHRDLKPANIKVTRDGTVKVLDFGLAKANDAGPTGSDTTNSPTMTSPALMTRSGMILGTASYMSPEQARGKTVDKRADIWAFGCVLFEMFTGGPVFRGDTVSEVLAAVIRDEPPLDLLPASTPLTVRTLLTRCLERDPKRRLRDIGEARIALDQTAPPATLPSSTPAHTAGHERPRWSRAIPWVVAAGALAIAAFFAIRPASMPAVTQQSHELEIGPPPDSQFLIGSNSGGVSLSPDGRRIVYRALTGNRDQLWIRSLGRDDAKPLAGTDGAVYQFWAPDSRRIGFFAAGKLKTLDLAAGLPQSLTDVGIPRGGSWSGDDQILMSIGNGAIYRVPASGGTLTPVTHLDTGRGENAHYWPEFLPGGRRFLFFVRSTRIENSGIFGGTLDGGEPVRVVSSLSSGLYAPPLGARPAHLLWVQNGDLLAQPFDAERAALSGQPSTIASGVRVLESQRGIIGSVSRNGVIAWASPRGVITRTSWYGRDGRPIEQLPVEILEPLQLNISPDGRRVAFTQPLNGTADVMAYDFATAKTRRVSTSPDYDELPIWSPDSTEVLYRGNTDGVMTLIRTRLDGSAPPVELMRGRDQLTPAGWSPDGRYILILENVPGRGLEMMIFPADDPTKVTPLITGPGYDRSPVFSPDGRWIAFNSNRTGRVEGYVARFRGDQSPPAIGHPIQVTSEGGGVFDWRRDGKELLIGSGDDQVMSVSVDARGEQISIGEPVPLFRMPANHGAVTVSRDGQRVLIVEYPYAAGQTLHVLTNWHERIK